MRERSASFVAGALVLIATLTFPSAQEKTVDHGVYTAAQAVRGGTVFDSQCATCHRDGGAAPVLAGERFTRSFSDATLTTVFTTIKTTMPRTSPGSLTDADYTDVVAHLLRLNGYPDGMNELGLTDLAGIKIPGQTGDLNLALVQVVGCLAQTGRNWTLSRATEPVRTREPDAANDDEAQQLDASPSGSRTFRLQQVYDRPTGWVDEKVAVKGFLSRSGTDERVTVTSLRTLSSKCP